MRASDPRLHAFGHTLRRVRRARDLSQDALAGISGVSAKHIGEIERARKEPGILTAMKLWDALDVPWADFVAEVQQMT